MSLKKILLILIWSIVMVVVNKLFGLLLSHFLSPESLTKFAINPVTTNLLNFFIYGIILFFAVKTSKADNESKIHIFLTICLPIIFLYILFYLINFIYLGIIVGAPNEIIINTSIRTILSTNSALLVITSLLASFVAKSLK